MPTDTVYGIAALPQRADAVARIFDLKGRPDDKPLPVLGASRADLSAVARFDEDAVAVTDRFWPGPLTLVLPRADGFDADLGGDDKTTVAVRVPQSPLALALLRNAGPLAVTSANRSGEPPSATIEEARGYFEDGVALYLDEGPSNGASSTVASLIDGLTILRAGPVSEDDLRQIVTS